jgi:hypothetical protein
MFFVSRLYPSESKTDYYNKDAELEESSWPKVKVYGVALVFLTVLIYFLLS